MRVPSSTCGFLYRRSICGRYVQFWSFFYLIDPRNTDRPTKENVRSAQWEKLSDFRKSLHIQKRTVVRWDFWAAGLVCFVEEREFEHPGMQDRINEEKLRISGTRRAKSMSEDGAGICTRPIKCENTVKRYVFYRYIFCWNSIDREKFFSYLRISSRFRKTLSCTGTQSSQSLPSKGCHWEIVRIFYTQSTLCYLPKQ